MSGNVTQLLSAIDSGDPKAAEELLPLVYEELRRLAGHKMAGERPDHTLQATALVHEAYLRLVQESNQQWRNRSQFFAVAAETMRRILVDRARRLQSLKPVTVPCRPLSATMPTGSMVFMLILAKAVRATKTPARITSKGVDTSQVLKCFRMWVFMDFILSFMV